MKTQEVSDTVDGTWFGCQGNIDKDDMRPLYDIASMKAYEDSGFVPIPERDITANHFEFNRNTINEILPPEMAYSYFNHRSMFIDCNRKEWSKPSNVLSRFGRDVAQSAAYYMGRGSRAEVLPQGIHKGPAIIVGSGISLDTAIPFMRKWAGGIVTSTSQASTLMYHGITPTHIINFDMRTGTNEYDCNKWDYDKTVQITWPGIHPDVHGVWKGRKYYYRVYDPSVAFYAYALPAGYNWITTQMQPFAHSLAMQAAAANWMGYSPLILVGADFCFKTDSTRFTAWFYRKPDGEKRKRWIEYRSGPVDDMKMSTLLITTAGGQISSYTMLHYRKTTLAEQWIDESNLFDCSDGILDGMLPKADIEEVCRTQGRCLVDRIKQPRVVRDRLEPWLATEDTYFIPMLGGHKLIMANGSPHLRMSLEQLKIYDDNLDIDFEHKRLWDLHEEGERLRESGFYGRAGKRE